MNDIKELAKWLEEEVEFLKNNQDYVGGWYDLGNGLGAVVLWEEGWGDEIRDDAIQATDNPDWALCAGIMLINRDDTPDGWFMPWDSKTGDIICETTGITPNEDFEKLAGWLLDDFNVVKDLEIKSNGEVIGFGEGEKESEEPLEESNEDKSYAEKCKDEVVSGSQAISYKIGDDKWILIEEGQTPFILEVKDKQLLFRDPTEPMNPVRVQYKDLDDYISHMEIEDEEPQEESLKECKKKMIKESKEYSTSPYHDVIAEYFDYSGDFEFLDVVASVLGRISNFEDDEDIYQSLDDELIYTYDQWKVLMHYCTPQDANWETALSEFMNDIFSICATIGGMNHKEDDDFEEPEEGDEE